MTREEVMKAYQQELRDIADQCEAEGLPSNGSTFELRADDVREWYAEQYPEYFN